MSNNKIGVNAMTSRFNQPNNTNNNTPLLNTISKSTSKII